MSAGVVLRVKGADAARVRELAGKVSPRWQVVGRALWDVGELPELTAICAAQSAAEIDLRGDFGHVFGAAAELRWRRVDATRYDLLILSDSPLEIDGADTLGQGWRIEPKTLRGGLRLRTAHYLAPNGAVQFVSYREVLG